MFSWVFIVCDEDGFAAKEELCARCLLVLGQYHYQNKPGITDRQTDITCLGILSRSPERIADEHDAHKLYPWR
jgi:hypothetical protein